MTFPTSRGGCGLLACWVALCATIMLAGCRAGQGKPYLKTAAPPMTAPPQKAARLALVQLVFGNPPKLDVVTVRADGGGREKLTRRSKLPGVTLLRVAGPAWSPDARSIYFTGTVAERQGPQYVYYETDIFAMRADGSNLQRLTSTGDASSPIASPDGKTIAFARAEGPGAFPVTSSLWLMNTDGTGRQRVVNSKAGQIDKPGAWAPDGRTLVFTRCRFALPRSDGLIPNTCAIYAATRDRPGVQHLADRAAAPAYSPDGTQIAFVSDRDENGMIAAGSDENTYAGELYVMTSDGGSGRRAPHGSSTRAKGLRGSQRR
jgi:Tol biopolymer transport system component